MTTTPTIPQWLAGRVPASTIETGAILAAELEEIAGRLAPLLLQLRGLVETRDRLIALRLADEGEPLFSDGQNASTTRAGYDVVLETFKVVEEGVFRAPFDAVTRIGDLVEQFEWAGLQWDVAEATS